MHAVTVLQAPRDLLAWMRDFGFSTIDIATVADLEFDLPPSLVFARDNVASLQQVLHMSSNQVCVFQDIMHDLLVLMHGQAIL